MLNDRDRAFGGIITRLINKQNLSREEAFHAFRQVLADDTTQVQQGAFLAALVAKGETADEVAGGWQAIYELDTTRVEVKSGSPLVENSGTGMDTFKTFNISTAASLIGAAGGVRMARHGARAITSVCGTVDMAEALGVDVECPAEMVAQSIDAAGIGLFNGMSPEVHPNALGRILSQIAFGSPLNIAASLANPATPKRAVRGVYARDLVMPVARVMKAIGYEHALVVYGTIEGQQVGMDEASVCGTTYGAELTPAGEIRELHLRPADVGLPLHRPDDLAPAADRQQEARRFVSLIQGRTNGVRRDAVLLNAGMIFLVAGKAETIEAGVDLADATLNGAALDTLEQWVRFQNRDPQKGLAQLKRLMAA